MGYTTDELLLASKVFEMADERWRKACQADAQVAREAGLLPEEVPSWIDTWEAANPKHEFVENVLRDLCEVADIIRRHPT